MFFGVFYFFGFHFFSFVSNDIGVLVPEGSDEDSNQTLSHATPTDSQ